MRGRSARVVRLAMLASTIACGCRTKDTVETKVKVDSPKLTASIEDFQPSQLSMGGARAAVTLSGTGPHGYFSVRLDSAVGPTRDGKPALAASPDGDKLAFAPDAREPWIVFFLTPERKKLTSDFRHTNGALASTKRTLPAGPSVDWSKVPDFLDVAADMVRESHPSSSLPEYQRDVLGEVKRRGGDAALAKVLLATADVVGAEPNGITFARLETCSGESAWLSALRTLPQASVAPIRDALEKSLATPKLDAERVLRAALVSPLDDKSLAAAMQARARELFDVDTTIADYARALLVRRLAALSPGAAADVGCDFLDAYARRKVGPQGQQSMVRSDATECAALLAIANAKRACPVVVARLSSPEGPPEQSVADEVKEPAELARKRVAVECATRTRTLNEYLVLAQAVQPKGR